MIEEQSDRWVVKLPEPLVTRLAVDWAVNIQFGDDEIVHLQIGSPYKVVVSGTEHQVDPENPHSVGPMLALLRQNVDIFDLCKDGRLEMQFGSGDVLRVPVCERFEAWQLDGVDGVSIISLPGGGLSRWRNRHPEPQSAGYVVRKPHDIALGFGFV